jgi:hypothetical protein
MAGEAYTSGAPLLANGDANEILPPGFDQFSLTPQEREEYGIREGEQHSWIRDPDYWAKHEMNDRAREYVREGSRCGETRRVIVHNGQPVTNGDLILCAYSGRKEPDTDVDTGEELIEQARRGDFEDIPRWRLSDRDSIREYAENQHFENVESGMIGPTAGMNYADVRRMYGEAKVEAEKARYRNGSMHVDATPDAESRAQGAYERARGQSQRNFSGSGFPRNQNSPLAQAQRRAGKPVQ